jgi:hypothetical protein
MSQGIEVILNGITFRIPTSSQHNWADLTDWMLEVNEMLNITSTTFVIPASSANLVVNTPVSLYTINNPQNNSNIIFEYGIKRATTGVGAQSLSETGTLTLAYDEVVGTWETANVSVGDAQVTIDVSSNVIRATAAPLTGDAISTNVIFFNGRIIRV